MSFKDKLILWANGVAKNHAVFLSFLKILQWGSMLAALVLTPVRIFREKLSK